MYAVSLRRLRKERVDRSRMTNVCPVASLMRHRLAPWARNIRERNNLPRVGERPRRVGRRAFRGTGAEEKCRKMRATAAASLMAYKILIQMNFD